MWFSKYIDQYIKITTADDTKYYLAKKNEDGTLSFPLEFLQKKDDTIPVIMYYQIFPFKGDYVIVKVMLKYVNYNIMYNNDKYQPSWLLKNPKMLWYLKNEYYFVYNFLQYIKEWTKVFPDSNHVVTKTASDKVNRYEYIKSFIGNYQERLLSVYVNDHKFEDITKVIQYFKNQTFIEKLSKFKLLKRYIQKEYKIEFMDLTEREKNILEWVKKVFYNQENLYPLLFWYLSIENDNGFYRHPSSWNKINHLFYSFENEILYKDLLKDALSNTWFIIKQGYLVLNLWIYISMVEEYYTYLFFKNRTRVNILDLKADIATSKEDKLTVKMEDMLYDTWLYNFLKIMELSKNNYLLWNYENIIALSFNNIYDDMYSTKQYEEIWKQFNKNFRPFQWYDDQQWIICWIPKEFIEQWKTQIYKTEDFFKVPRSY